MDTLTATYSPEDNKLRLYATSRLDSETYARVKAAGFKWAPKQDLFVAPMWTPGRADLLLELCGEIDDEDTSLVDRAEERADRFDDYRDKRTSDANRAHAAVSAIADQIPFGQPILVGHHSERHARKDAQRIENSMRKAVKMWDTAQYWKSRADGAIRAAKYKELPSVRARRIKGIEADKRKSERTKADSVKFLGFWIDKVLTMQQAVEISNFDYISHCFTLEEYPRSAEASQYEGAMSLYSALTGGVINETQASELAIAAHTRTIKRERRWIEHYENRLTYERAMLEEQGGTDLLKPAPRKEQLPLCNYRAPEGIDIENMYRRGEMIHYPQIEMTKAEYARINTDYKGTRTVDNTHRVRTAVKGHELYCVFLTDSKVHQKPASELTKAATGENPSQEEAAPELAAPAGPEAELRRIWTAQGVPEEKQNALIEGIAAKAQPGAQVGPFTIPPACGYQTAAITCTKPNIAGHQKIDCAICDTGTAQNLVAKDAATANADTFNSMREQLKQGVGVVIVPQLLPTSHALAADMVDRAKIESGHSVLDPEAGTGRILRAIRTAPHLQGFGKSAIRTAVEINGALCDALRINEAGAEILQRDFLRCGDELGKFDRIIMNPPFANAQDIAHIKHALTMLKPGGRLVALCANGPRQNEQLRPLAGVWEVLPPGSFAESGTMVNVVLLIING